VTDGLRNTVNYFVNFYRATLYASAVYVVACVCPNVRVRMSVCPEQTSIANRKIMQALTRSPCKILCFRPTLLFNGPDNPQISHSRSVISTPSRLVHMVHWAHPSYALSTKRHLYRFSRFCRDDERGQATHTQTDRPRYSVYSNRPHLMHWSSECNHAMRPKTHIFWLTFQWIALNTSGGLCSLPCYLPYHRQRYCTVKEIS